MHHSINNSFIKIQSLGCFFQQGMVQHRQESNERFAINSAAEVWSRQRHLESGYLSQLQTCLISLGKCQRYFCSVHWPKRPNNIFFFPPLFLWFFFRDLPFLCCKHTWLPKIRLLHKLYIKKQPPKENSATEYKTQLLESCTVTVMRNKPTQGKGRKRSK